jgi:hypothetical protein
MRSITVSLAAAVAAALALPAAAPAKGLLKAVVCGADGCADVTARIHHNDRIMDSEFAEAAPRHRAPFYRVRFTIGVPGQPRSEGRVTVLYVPRLGLLRSVDDTGQVNWMRTSTNSRHLLRLAVAGRRPLPAAKLSLGAPASASASTPTNGARPPEVVAAPAAAVDRSAGGDGANPWLFVAIGLGVVVAGALGGRWVARRRHGEGG